jgi:HTH-type transcriptional regulator, transcriptional repressor of NAD biosynthesis genes
METLARPWRICVTGPESTGKTTLAAMLASRFGTVWVPEYAREYALAAGRELTRDDVEPIARGQVANEDRLIGSAKGLIVFDTDLISTMVYARYYYGFLPPWIAAAARDRKSDLYLLHDIDVPFVRDAARDVEEDRKAHFELFKQALEEQDANVVIVRGDWAARNACAIAAVEQLLNRR